MNHRRTTQLAWRGRAGAILSIWGLLLLAVSVLAAPAAVATQGTPPPPPPPLSAGYQAEGANTFTTATELPPNCNGIIGNPGSAPADKRLNTALTSLADETVGGAVHYIYTDNQPVPTAFRIDDCEVVYPPDFFGTSDFKLDGSGQLLTSFTKHDLSQAGTIVGAAELTGVTSTSDHEVFFAWKVADNDNIVPGAWVCNFASDIAEGHGGEGNRKASPTCFEVQGPDLLVNKVPVNDTVAAGHNVVWTVTVKNTGTLPTGTVTVTDATPDNTTFVSVDAPSTFNCTTPDTGATGTTTCTGGPIAAGATATFTVTDQVDASVADKTVISNTARAASDGITSDDDDSHTATATVSSPQQQTPPDVHITKEALTPGPKAGQEVSWSVVAYNDSSVAADAVTVDDPTPANTTFEKVTVPSGFTCPTTPPAGGTGNLECTGTLAANSHATFTVYDIVDSGTAAGTHIDNTATVAQAGLTSDDDDTATAHAIVQSSGGNQGGGPQGGGPDSGSITTSTTVPPKAPPTTILGTVIMPKVTTPPTTVPTQVLPFVVTRTPLPVTGSNTRLFVLAGAGLLVMGGLLLLLGDRRWIARLARH